MKLLKRVFISIYRNFTQSILLFLIVVILGNILFASIAVKQTSASVKDELRSRTSSYLYMTTANVNHAYRIVNDVKEFVEKISEDERIKYMANYTVLNISENIKIRDNGASWSECHYMGVENANENLFKFELENGRYFTQEEIDNGENKIVILDGYGYEVGDTYQVYIPDYVMGWVEDSFGYSSQEITEIKGEYIDFEVIGTLKADEIKTKVTLPDDFYAYNKIIPTKSLKNIITLANELANKHSDEDKKGLKYASGGNAFKTSYYHFLTYIEPYGLDACEELETELVKMEDYPSIYALKTGAQDFRYVHGPLENLDALADVALVSSVILVIVILSLVTNLFIKHRTKEIGILMAIGERKMKILGQFVLEILIVGMLATSVSMVTGNMLGNVISKSFMEIQIDVDSEMQFQEDNPDELTQLDLLNAYEIEITSEYIITIYAMSFVILMASSALPMISIMRTKPKNILI